MASISEFWASEEVYPKIVRALEAAGKTVKAGLTVEDLAPVDHYHAGGFASTVELVDQLPVRPSDRLLDIGCGIGGPARYIASRFGCAVDGIDITPQFIDAAQRLTQHVGLQDRVKFTVGDGAHLPYEDRLFDGAICQHVTMNVQDREHFFAEVFRVLKPGAFFALTEHGLGPQGSPQFPTPWSQDGSFSFLMTPADTEAHLKAAGFEDLRVELTGPRYLAGYKRQVAMAAEGGGSALGVHILIGPDHVARMRNSVINIAEGRTAPVRVICRKPS